MMYTDPDFSTIYAHAANPGGSPRVNDTAGQVAATAGKVAGATDGKGGPESFTGDAAEVGKVLAGLATDAAISTAVWADLKKAADAWKSAAPKAEEMNGAEKAVTDAQAASTDAIAKADAAPDDKELADAAEKAGQEVIDAKKTLIDLQRKRKAANKSLLEAIGRAIAKAKKITGATVPGKDGDTGRSTPGGGTGNGTSSGTSTQSTGSGAPSSKPGGTPAAAPGVAKPAGTPAETTTATPTSTPDPGIASLLSSLNQQQPQQAQPAATQQATPAATVPQQNQQGQPGQNKKTDGAIDVDDLIREGALPASAAVSALGLSSPSPSTTSAATPTSTVQQASTTLRPEFKPASLAAAAAQNPVTSGTSATGLTTSQGNTEVSGRADPPRTATSPSPGTHTSGATETTQRAGDTQQQGRPAAGAGMPMSPGIMGAPGGAAPASRSGDGENRPGVVRYQDGEIGRHGEEALREATPGGTIAQNRPDRDKPAA